MPYMCTVFFFTTSVKYSATDQIKPVSYTIIFVCFQIPGLNIPLRYMSVIGSCLPSFVFMYKTSYMILQGGVGKNKSTVAVSSVQPKFKKIYDILHELSIRINFYQMSSRPRDRLIPQDISTKTKAKQLYKINVMTSFC